MLLHLANAAAISYNSLHIYTEYVTRNLHLFICNTVWGCGISVWPEHECKFYNFDVLRTTGIGIGIGIGIENTTSSGIGIGIGIESLTFQVLELVLVLKKMTSGIGIGIDLLSSWDTAIR